MTRIAVLITCHNRKEKTIASLKSLTNCQLPDFHAIDIFLVDDGSTDGTSEAIKIEFPLVHIIHGNGHLYWNRGMILAWETAIKENEFDFYLWLNDDTILFNNAIETMLNGSMKMNNERIIVGATCSELTKSISYGGFRLKNKLLSPDGTWQRCDFFNGNIVLIPSCVFKSVGFLDHRFWHALGDIDYGLRALKLGFVHYLSPHFLGNCENHETDPVWYNKSFPMFKRLENLYTPLGNNTLEFFIFDRRHNGIFMAIFHFLTIHLRAIFPSLWKSKL